MTASAELDADHPRVRRGADGIKPGSMHHRNLPHHPNPQKVRTSHPGSPGRSLNGQKDTLGHFGGMGDTPQVALHDRELAVGDRRHGAALHGRPQRPRSKGS